MLGIRLITTGLKETIHSVIGYEEHTDKVTRYLIKPNADTQFDFDAMCEVNNLKISDLQEQGLERGESLQNLAKAISQAEKVLCWYAPFIYLFLRAENIDFEQAKFVDLLPLAMRKVGFHPIDFSFKEVCKALNCEEHLMLVNRKLEAMASLKSVRRL